MKSAIFLILCPLVILGQAVTRNHVYIYNDYGADELHVLRLQSHLRQLLGSSYVVRLINATDVISGDWKNNAALFMMPGGFDLGFIHSLGNLGAEQIREYVRQGGSYLGTGAGSYYACDRIEFGMHTEDEVHGERPLKFYPDLCSGPLFGSYSYYDYSTARAADITFHYIPTSADGTNLVSFKAYYNGGNTFNVTQANSVSNCVTLGTFDHLSNAPAIVKCNVNNGRAVLSSVHLEFGSEHLNPNDPYLAVIQQALNSDVNQRHRLPVYKSLLKHLRLTSVADQPAVNVNV